MNRKVSNVASQGLNSLRQLNEFCEKSLAKRRADQVTKGKSTKITTVLLDAGGVILDETEQERVRGEIIVEVLSSVVAGYSTSTYEKDVQEAVECFSPRQYAYVFWKHLRNDIALFNKLYNLHIDLWQERQPGFKLCRGIENELKRICQKFKVGIAGQYGKEIISFLEAQGVLECFAYRLTQDDFSITKPDPRYYEQITKAFGVMPQECIMVGDRIDNDIIPAKQLGMKTILIRQGLHVNQKARTPFELADAELEGVVGLAGAVRSVAEAHMTRA